MKSFAIIIPAHNEENRIKKTLKSYLDYFKKLKENKVLDFTVIIVLNGCEDDTKGVAKGFKCKEIEVIEFKEKGKGFAVTEGFKHALKKEFDFIGFVDADCATPPGAFHGLIRNIGNYDGIIANRWDKNSLVSPRQTLFRRFISRGFNMIVRAIFLFPHRDTQCGAKLFKKELVEKIYKRLGSSEWSFDVDLLFYARREGARIKSVPTEWHDQKGSKINLKKTPERMFFSVIRLRIVHSPFKFLLRFHNKLPKKMQVSSWFK